MPDFQLTTTSNLELRAWTDPPTDDRPTRINPALGIQHLRYSGKPRATASIQFAMDSGSTSFVVTAWFAEAPGAFPWPPITVGAAPAMVSFTPERSGHHTLVVRHDLGGSLVIHIDVEQQ